MSILIAALPIIIATFSMICLKKDTVISMMGGSASGVLVYLIINGFTVHNLMNVVYTAIDTFTDNWIVLANVFLLFVIVYLIRYSSIMDTLNDFLSRYLNSPVKMTAAMIVTAIIFSVDDYLVCIAMSIIFTDIAMQQCGFSREKTAYIINLLAISCCCLSPFSSWMPVLKSILVSAGCDDTYIYRLLPMNYFALGAIVMTVLVCFKKDAFQSSHHLLVKTEAKPHKDNTRSQQRELLSFGMVITTLISMTLLGTLVFKTSYAIILAACLSIALMIPCFLNVKAISGSEVKKGMKDALTASVDLSKMLLSIWFMSNVTNRLLCLSANVGALSEAMEFPAGFIALAVYITSSIFTFFTGSAYGGFAVFVPLAFHLSSSLPGNVTMLSVAAAISGSLMAGASYASDTMKLSVGNTHSDLQYVQKHQMPYSLITFLSGFAAFLIAGLAPENLLLGSLSGLITMAAGQMIIFTVYQKAGSREAPLAKPVGEP